MISFVHKQLRQNKLQRPFQLPLLGEEPISNYKQVISVPKIKKYHRPALDPNDLGQYMTPLEVADKMVQSVKIHPSLWNVLDPSCGDGNLLLAACKYLDSKGVKDISSRVFGFDVDPNMVKRCRGVLASFLKCSETALNIHCQDFLLFDQEPLLKENYLRLLRSINLVIANPPYGKNRESLFFDTCNRILTPNTYLVFLMPLSFVDKTKNISYLALKGRPLGVTTGHAIINHKSGKEYSYKRYKGAPTSQDQLQVYIGVKLYEVGAGKPAQTKKVVTEKPFSRQSSAEGFIGCIRTGDLSPFKIKTPRLYVNYGPHLAHPKDLAVFKGPKIFLRRVPVWKSKRLCATFTKRFYICAGDVLCIRAKLNNEYLLKDFCKFLNSRKASDFIFKNRPSIRLRDSFPKISAKDVVPLFDYYFRKTK
jgi:predicted RNA methylase